MRTYGSKRNRNGTFNKKALFKLTTWELVFQDLAREEASERNAFNDDQVKQPLIQELVDQDFGTTKEVYNYINKRGSGWKANDTYPMSLKWTFIDQEKYSRGSLGLCYAYYQLDEDNFPFIFYKAKSNG